MCLIGTISFLGRFKEYTDFTFYLFYPEWLIWGRRYEMFGAKNECDPSNLTQIHIWFWQVPWISVAAAECAHVFGSSAWHTPTMSLAGGVVRLPGSC